MTEVTMAQGARPSGASTKQRVFGDQKQAPGDPFLAPFFDTAVEHVWGGVWNRPGLELKYRSLVVVWVACPRFETMARRKFDQAFLGIPSSSGGQDESTNSKDTLRPLV